MSKLKISFACCPYDRLNPIISGRVPVEGCDCNFFPLRPEELFPRVYGTQDFDVTELSASWHILTTLRGDAQYVAIPAFVSRVFRHGDIYIRTDRGIRSPEDLRGKSVGVPEYQMTAALWIRGILSDEYGVEDLGDPVAKRRAAEARACRAHANFTAEGNRAQDHSAGQGAVQYVG